MDISLSILMADTIPRNGEPSHVDLLIESDYFWSIIDAEQTTLLFALFLKSLRID